MTDVFGQPAFSGALPGALAEIRGLSHSYGNGTNQVEALRLVDLDVLIGERLAVMGRSGSGKTTLLNILAGLEKPMTGRVVVAGHDLTRIGRRNREAYRRRTIGYVWQQSEAGLLMGLTALQNVLVPMLGDGSSQLARIDAAIGLLDALRLGDWLYYTPDQLAPAELQRLAVAVALANGPQLLLVDELTARLDWPTARELLGDIGALLGNLGTAAIIVTHDPRVGRYVDRTILIRDGVAAAAAGELVAGPQGPLW